MMGIFSLNLLEPIVVCLYSDDKNIQGRKSADEAKAEYKKEQEIKRIANLYKDKIPLKLYNAMMNYVVI